jgi:hypothetical protein
MPDLLVFDRKTKESYLVEIKASNSKDPSGCWIDKQCFESYIHCWPEVYLVVYLMTFGTVHCIKLTDLLGKKTRVIIDKNESKYYLNLKEFFNLPHYFTEMELPEYTDLNKKINSTLQTFTTSSLRQ